MWSFQHLTAAQRSDMMDAVECFPPMTPAERFQLIPVLGVAELLKPSYSQSPGTNTQQ